MTTPTIDHQIVPNNHVLAVAYLYTAAEIDRDETLEPEVRERLFEECVFWGGLYMKLDAASAEVSVQSGRRVDDDTPRLNACYEGGEDDVAAEVLSLLAPYQEFLNTFRFRKADDRYVMIPTVDL